jgi:hypothetical protein
MSLLYSGDDNFYPVEISWVLTVARAPLTVTADNQDINHGDAMPALTYTCTGFVLGQNASVLGGSPNLSVLANANQAAGIYPIQISPGSLSSANYTFQFVPGTLTVHPRVTNVLVDWGGRQMSILNLSRDLPFVDITAVDIVFSDDVAVQEANLSLAGSSSVYTFSGFHYNSSAREASWTLPSAIGVDKLIATLDGTTTFGVRSIFGGIHLKTDFKLAFSVLPGDFNGDGVVNSQDLVGVRNEMLGTGDPSQIGWADLDGNGKVDINDYNAVRKWIGKHL